MSLQAKGLDHNGILAQDLIMNGDDPGRKAAVDRTAPADGHKPLSGGRRAAWIALRIGLFAVAVWMIHFLYQWLVGVTAEITNGAQIRLGLTIVMLTAYAVLIAVPFVPGIEVGVMLLMLHGGQIAPAVYMATVAGLCIAFATGHWLPVHVLGRVLRDMRLHRIAELVAQSGAESAQRRLARMRRKLPRRLGKLLIRQRYFLLAMLINLPGNAVIGGGGGIALTSGLSRLYAPLPTLATLLVAVAPVPVLIWLFDRPILPLIG